MLIYLLAPLSNDVILPVGFVLGFINLMMFSPMGSFMTELYPTSVRGVAQGFCYNVGRGIGAIFPVMVGFLADRYGLANAIVVFSGFWLRFDGSSLCSCCRKPRDDRWRAWRVMTRSRKATWPEISRCRLLPVRVRCYSNSATARMGLAQVPPADF